VTAPLLEVTGLTVRLPSRRGPLTIVDDVDYLIEQGQVFGVAGESGSGKTISMLALLRLLPAGAQVEGTAMFQGRDLLALGRRALEQVRGKELAMVFQDPLTSLHPMLSVGRQLTEHVRKHDGATRKAAETRAVELLEQVRIPDPEKGLHAYPHQFSGGMRQRIAIAIALACRPKLLIADEPTTALDVTVQAGLLELLDALRRDTGLGVVLITHDLGVLSAIADRVSIFYAGRIVESGPRQELMTAPRHPYTRALIDALPHVGVEGAQLVPIAGAPPTPATRPGGCAFHPRCPYAVPACSSEPPPLVAIGADRMLACPVDPLRADAPGGTA
jgi:oligopeptide/dipeptide ABC transporter ATP-binding protein